MILNGTGQLDVANSQVAVNYGAGPSPAAALKASILSGYNGGTWTGPGIISSTIATHPGTGIGSVDGNGSNGAAVGTFLLGYALLGDTNLKGSVGLSDYNVLAAHFNQPGNWSKGDFDYNGVVGLSDYNLLAANFNHVTAPPAAGGGGSASAASASGAGTLSSAATTLTGGGSANPSNLVDPGAGKVALEVDTTSGKLYLVGDNAHINSYEIASAGGKLSTFKTSPTKGSGGYNTLTAQSLADFLPGSNNPDEQAWSVLTQVAHFDIAEAYPLSPAAGPAYDMMGPGLQVFDLNFTGLAAWTAGTPVSDLTFGYGNGTGATLNPAVIDLGAATPEPTTLSLLGLGAMGLMARRRRNAAKKA